MSEPVNRGSIDLTRTESTSTGRRQVVALTRQLARLARVQSRASMGAHTGRGIRTPVSCGQVYLAWVSSFVEAVGPLALQDSMTAYCPIGHTTGVRSSCLSWWVTWRYRSERIVGHVRESVRPDIQGRTRPEGSRSACAPLRCQGCGMIVVLSGHRHRAGFLCPGHRAVGPAWPGVRLRCFGCGPHDRIGRWHRVVRDGRLLCRSRFNLHWSDMRHGWPGVALVA